MDEKSIRDLFITDIYYAANILTSMKLCEEELIEEKASNFQSKMNNLFNIIESNKSESDIWDQILLFANSLEEVASLVKDALFINGKAKVVDSDPFELICKKQLALGMLKYSGEDNDKCTDDIKEVGYKYINSCLDICVQMSQLDQEVSDCTIKLLNEHIEGIKDIIDRINNKKKDNEKFNDIMKDMNLGEETS